MSWMTCVAGKAAVCPDACLFANTFPLGCFWSLTIFGASLSIQACTPAF